jgi:hypothetical protein
MKLLLSGRAGSRACDWSSYALLRDNVQHFVEHGGPNEHFSALHGIEGAVDDGRCAVDAARLRGEVLRAWYALWAVPPQDAAVSLRTRAILTKSVDEPTVQGTVQARRAGWELPVEARGKAPLPVLAERFVTAVLALTESAVDGEVLLIERAGPPPHFRRAMGARRSPGQTGPTGNGS